MAAVHDTKAMKDSDGVSFRRIDCVETDYTIERLFEKISEIERLGMEYLPADGDIAHECVKDIFYNFITTKNRFFPYNKGDHCCTYYFPEDMYWKCLGEQCQITLDSYLNHINPIRDTDRNAEYVTDPFIEGMRFVIELSRLGNEGKLNIIDR